MKKQRLQELAGIPETNEYLEEGEIWDMIKGMGQVTIIMRTAVKKAKKAREGLDRNDPDIVKKVVKELKDVIKYVEDEVGKTKFDDELKKSTIDSFKNGMKEELDKLSDPAISKAVAKKAINQVNEEFTQKDWDKHISHVADIIVDMAKSDADGDKGELLDNVKNYLQDATDDISAGIRKRLKG